MNNKRKVSIADIINIRKMIKVHLTYLANKKLIYRLDNRYVEVFDVPVSCICTISRYKILENTSISYYRTIEDVEKCIKVINVLIYWLNGIDILYIDDKSKTEIIEPIPLISTLTANKYKILK